MVSSHTLLLLIAALITLTLAYASSRRGNVAGARSFTLLMLAVTVWSAAYGFEINSKELTQITFWVRIEYIGIVSIPVFWLVFALQYTGRELWLTKRNRIYISIEPILALALFWTNSAHELFWKDTSLVEKGDLTLATFTHGTGFWVNAAYSYVLLILGAFLITRSLLLSRKLFRGQVVSIMIGVAAPWIGNGLYLSGMTPFPYLDPTPFAFTVTGIAVAWALFHLRFLEIVPIARATLIANLPDGVIVLDLNDRIVDLNPAAERIFNLSSDSVSGCDTGIVFSNHKDLIAAIGDQTSKFVEINQADKQEKRFYDIRVSPIDGNAHGLVGRVMVLRDVTEQEKNAETLKNREAILEAVRFAATHFLMTTSWEESIQLVLECLGKATKASRVYIFENQLKSDDVLVANQRYEWAAPGITAQINNPDLQAFPYREGGYERWEQILSQQRPIYGLIDDFLPSERELLESQQIESMVVVPIFAGNLWWGFIGYDECTYKRQWTRAEIDALEAAAHILGSSIQRKITDDKQLKRSGELATLYEISLEIISTQAKPQLLQTIVEKAVGLIGGTGGGLYLCDAKKREVRCVTSTNTQEDYSGTVLKYGEGASGIVAQTGQPLIIDDYRAWKGRARVYEEDQPFRSVVSAPLSWLGEIIGVIHVLHNQETYQFNEDDLRLLTLFANQAAIVLHNAQSYEVTQQRVRKMALLNDITIAALEIGDLTRMLEHLTVRMAELLDADGCSISLWSNSWDREIPSAAFGSMSKIISDGRINPKGMKVLKAALDMGKPIIVEDISQTSYISPRLAEKFPAKSLISIPLIAGEQKIGTALIAFDEKHNFTQDEMILSDLAAAQLAMAVAKTRSIEIERRRVDELDALRATMTDISGELELSALLRIILERATALLNATGGDLGLYEEDRDDILIVVSHNMGKDYRGTRMALGEGAMGRAVQHNETVVITNYHRWEGRSSQYNEGSWKSVLAVPLNFRGKVVGALGIVDKNQQRIFSQEDQRLLHLFAQQAATAIENARLYVNEKLRVTELEILYESSANVTKTLDLNVTYSMSAKQLALAVNATSSYILSCDLDSGMATVLAHHYGPEANAYERKPDIGTTYDMNNFTQTLEALRAGEPLTVMANDPKIDRSDWEELTRNNIKSTICVPMIVSNQFLGYAEIWESRFERAWSPEEVRLCQTIANQAAVAIENAHLYHKMQNLAVTDVLTGVYNRRGLFDIGQREINRARRYVRPLSAIMLDIDHFKQINDIHSHAIGDMVLRSLAKQCQGNLRGMDVLGRYGGEEFAILLPETDQKAAYTVAERLRQMIANTPIHTKQGPINITVSMGVASVTVEIEDLAVLLDRADTAMYQAKNSGRNRVAGEGFPRKAPYI